MRVTDAVDRPLLILPAGIALQWLTVAAVAARAEAVSVDALEAAQILVLGPLTLVAAYVVASRIGGVALAAWTVLVWVATPWVAHALALSAYDPTLREHVLPLVLGLERDAGYLEGAALVTALALALLRTRVTIVAAAVLATGLAVVWVRRAIPFPDVSWEVLQALSGSMREYFWSQRLLQWLPLAGAVAVARRSPAAAAALLGWFVAYVVLRAAQPGTGFEDGEVFRALLPALPAYVLLAAALPLLVPTLAERLGRLAIPAARPPVAPAPPAAPPAARGSRSGPTGATAPSSSGEGRAG